MPSPPRARSVESPPRPAPRASRRAALAAGIGWLVAAAGCDIRDEVPRPPRPRALLDAAVPSPVPGQRAIEYVGGYAAGRQRAAAEGRPLLLICTAAWCRYSAELSQRTLRDPRLVAVSRRAVCVAVDADRDAADLAELGVRAFPTLVVLDAAGDETFRSTGRASAEDLARSLERAFGARRVAAAPDDAARE